MTKKGARSMLLLLELHQGILDRHRIGRGVETIDAYLAFIGRQQGVEHSQRGGLTGAIRTQKASDFPIANFERNPPDGFDLAKGLMQISNFDHFERPRDWAQASW